MNEAPSWHCLLILLGVVSLPFWLWAIAIICAYWPTSRWPRKIKKTTTEIYSVAPVAKSTPKKISVMFNSFTSETVAYLASGATVVAWALGAWALILSNRDNRAKDLVIASLKNETALARLETDRLKALFSWREITPEIQEKFKVLSKSFPKGKVTVSSPVENAEAVSYGIQIAEMLRVSGYEVSEEQGRIMQVGPPEKGVRLYMKQLGVNQVSLFAGTLKNGLEEIDIHSEWTANNEIGDTVKIMVFRKP